jgi:hypothetical protein
MIPVRWLTNRSRTRCSACRSSCSGVKLHHRALDCFCDRLRIAEVVLLSLRVRADILRWHRSGVVTKRLQLPTEMMPRCMPPCRLGTAAYQPGFDLTTRPLLTQHNSAAIIEPNDVATERIPQSPCPHTIARCNHSRKERIVSSQQPRLGRLCRAPNRCLERTPGQANGDAVLSNDRRCDHGRLLVCLGALPSLPHHERDRPAHARPSPRRGRVEPHSRALMPLMPAECAVR